MPVAAGKRGKVRRVDIYYSRVATKLPPPRGNPRNQRLDGDLNPFHLDTQINNGDAAMQDQVWWVTGASSGIGAALARGLAARGAKLILSGRNVAALEAVAKDIGAGTMILPFAATGFGAGPRRVEEAGNWCGRIDGLVNNAGISQRSRAVETDFSVYQKIIGVDLLAPIALTQQLLPRMVGAGGGQIVAISSVAGMAGIPVRSAYCAAKHGLIGYHASVRAENEHLGLKIGRAHVRTPATNAHPLCRLLLDQKNRQ